MANIRLNILPIKNKQFSFKVYRKLKLEGDKKEDNTWLYNLPQDMDINEYRSYWISFIPKMNLKNILLTQICLLVYQKNTYLNN